MGIIQKIKAKLASPAPVPQPAAVMNRLAGKKVCFAGKFQYGVRQKLSGMAEAQQATIVEDLAVSTDYLILQDATAGKAIQKKVLALNAKGASIQVLDTDALQKLVEPTADELLGLIRGGKANADRFTKAIGGSRHQVHFNRQQASPLFTFIAEKFDGLDLDGFNFAQIAFEQCSFVGTKLAGASFASAKACDFTGAVAAEAKFGDVIGTKFVKAVLTSANFQGSIANADYSAASLDNASFVRLVYGRNSQPTWAMPGCVFARASLTKSTFNGFSFVAPDFDGVNLTGARFCNGQCEAGSFRNANLTEATFVGCMLPKSNFNGANCRAANFAEADLTESRFDAADLNDCNMRAATTANVDFAKARGYHPNALPTGAIGPALTELDLLAQQARNVQIRFRLKTDADQEGKHLLINTSRLKYGWPVQIFPPPVWGRSQSQPNQSFSAALLRAANLLSNQKVRYETVEVKSTKSPKTGKSLRDLVIAGIAEAFAQPVPPAAELAAAMKAIRTTKTTQGAEARKQREEYKRRQEELKKRELKKIEKTIQKQVGQVTDIATFLKALELRADKSKIDKATKMLKAERFQLFNDITDTHLNGVVKSQTDADLVYACRIESNGHYACCTQNLNICGGLRGSICKHLLVLIVGLVKAGQLDPSTIDTWIAKTHDTKPELNKETMGEIFIRYKGAEAGEVDWRPTETVPEDYYAV